MIAQGDISVDDAKSLGDAFTDSLLQLSPGQWHGPVLSGYGVHLVYVSRISEPSPPVFTDVRERVLQDWTIEKNVELNEKFYANLRNQYTVVVEDSAGENKAAAVPGPAQ